MESCSAAAARKVSPAASMTFFPSACSRCASLPIVVVLPVPFTPTTSTTAGAALSENAEERADRISTRSCLQPLLYLRGRSQLVTFVPFFKVFEHERRRVDAHVGRYERLFKLIEKHLVDLLAEDQVPDLVRQVLSGLCKPVAETLEYAEHTIPRNIKILIKHKILNKS